VSMIEFSLVALSTLRLSGDIVDTEMDRGVSSTTTSNVAGVLRAHWKALSMFAGAAVALGVAAPTALATLVLLAICIAALFAAVVVLWMLAHAMRGRYIDLLIREARSRRVEALESAASLQRRVDILTEAKLRPGWRYASISDPARPKGFLRRLWLPGDGWRRIALAPVSLPVFAVALPFATVRSLASWDALHADDGYAGPPASIVRAITLFRQLPPYAMSLLCLAMWVLPVVVIAVFSDPAKGVGAHPGLVAVGALSWGLVLAVPGELPARVRGRIRVGLWLLGIAILIGADQQRHPHTGFESFLYGVRFTVVIDLVALLMLMPLIAVRSVPKRGEWRRISS
jgi:hypothetical protein